MQLKDLEDDDKLFECVAGSHAYGTQVPESDVDVRGIFVVPQRAHLSLQATPKQVSDKTNDVTFYELRRYIELAADCNPNIIELLWSPPDCIRIQTPVMDHLLAHRHLFVSLKAFQTFSGYAYAQTKRAKGQNKWVNNPQPETAPSKLDFCWVVPTDVPPNDEIFPLRPVKLEKTGLDLRHYHAAKMEHLEDTFRLYDYRDVGAKGVFRGDQVHLAVESIPKQDEWARFAGLLIFNRRAYDSALRNWKHYWAWRRNRNEARYRSQEAGEIDYDAKNMMHCVRLLWSGASILQTGEPLVRFDGKRLDDLMDIRAGRLTYEQIMAGVERQMVELDALHTASSLPKTVDMTAIDALYFSLLEML